MADKIDVSGLLEADSQGFNAVFETVEHELTLSSSGDAKLNLHFLRFSSAGEPRVADLITNLVNHITHYSIRSTERKQLTEAQRNRFFRMARDKFNLKDESGEPGELLLYFLLETVLKAPQIVCKIDLKTNRRDEVKGTDGLHVSWNEAKRTVNLYLGESKIHKEFSGAVSSAFASIQKIHDEDRLKHDALLVTNHYKHADDDTKQALLKLFDTSSSEKTYNLVHACLVGYEWSKYEQLNTEDRQTFIDNFKTIFLADFREHKFPIIKERLETFKYKHFDFHFFFIPFRDVAEFRTLLARELGAGSGA